MAEFLTCPGLMAAVYGSNRFCSTFRRHACAKFSGLPKMSLKGVLNKKVMLKRKLSLEDVLNMKVILKIFLENCP